MRDTHRRVIQVRGNSIESYVYAFHKVIYVKTIQLVTGVSLATKVAAYEVHLTVTQFEALERNANTCASYFQLVCGRLAQSGTSPS